MYAVTLPVAELVAYALEQQRRWREKEEQIKLALDTNLLPACITDRHMNIKCTNPAMVSMFGYTEQELVGKKLVILMASSMTKRHYDFITGFFGTDGREVEARHKDGHTVSVRIVLNTAVDQAVFMASFHDLAPEKARLKLERNMREMAMDKKEKIRNETTTTPSIVTKKRKHKNVATSPDTAGLR